ncbi:hypothetical protein UXP79_14040 [Enterobacter hormaechei]|jgi:hypothetical protein|uniref:hypothetical protein n=1 Tax=Enterobacter hormaechei TaxID=158836 RepID=UPI0021759811|nr:hypothetical protein [Enterobacter hormaechei]MCM7801126.1 hypothetical protein [Enterobacter hormaechei]MDO0900166.1 hypothetical protein [Enterobacter hormaechei]UVZ91495.1 hypothetical protein M5T14_02725 [Enterobacter hormaechei]
MSGNPLWNFPPTRNRWKNGWAICCSPYWLTLRTAGASRKKVTFTIYCQPPQGDMKVPVALPLSLNYHGHYVQVSMAEQA